MDTKRKTIMRTVKYNGIGLHKGEEIEMRLIPAEPNHGIVFKRTDIKENNIIRMELSNVFNPTRGTNLKNDFGVQIYTIEHFLAALYAYGITDLVVEVSNNELPIGDGSAFPFLELVDIAGVTEYENDVEILEIKTPVYIAEEDKYIVGLPYDGYKITYAVNYNHSFLKSQLAEYEINKDNFRKEIAKCRTFGFDFEVEYLKSNNLALGGSLENAIVVKNDGVLNPEGLRYEDEFVRHKILDLIGDMKILNKTIRGHIIAIKAGHSLDMKFAKKLIKL